MVKKLTIRTVESAAPKSVPYEIRDDEILGLLLRVQPSGVRTFYVDLKRGVRVRLGRYPGMTVSAARTRAKAAIGDFAKGGGQPQRKKKVLTLATFLELHYEPWVMAERKAGKATVAAIRSVWSALSGKSLDEINAWSVEKIKAARLKAGLKPATVNRDLVRIKAALAKAVEWQLLTTHPLTGVKRAKGEDGSRVRFLSIAEEKRLRGALEKREKKLKAARASGNVWRAERGHDSLSIFGKDDFSDHLQPIVLLALNTGLRRGELFSLRWSDVDIDRGMLTVRADEAKSGKARHIPLNSEAVSVFKRWGRNRSREGLIFPGPAGSRMTNINKSWAGLAALAQLEDFRFHDARHHFASKLVMVGVDLYTVRELLGHSDFAMTQRYAHLAPEHKAAAVQKLVAK